MDKRIGQGDQKIFIINAKKTKKNFENIEITELDNDYNQ